MNNNDLSGKIDKLLAAEAIPDRLKDQLRRVQSDLLRARRIVVMGPPNSAKKEVVSFLAGGPTGDIGRANAALQLAFGEAPSSIFEFENGESVAVNGYPAEGTTFPYGQPVSVKVKAPLPALKRIELSCPVDKNTFNDQVTAMISAAAGADIGIWCTQGFKAIEKKIWDAIPEDVREKFIVVKTNVDVGVEPVANALANLTQASKGYFASRVAVDIERALHCQNSQPIDTQKMKQWGGSALISVIMKEIKQFLTGVEDQVDVLSVKYQVSTEPTVAEETSTVSSIETEQAQATADKSDKSMKSDLQSLMMAVNSAKKEGVNKRAKYVQVEEEVDEFEQLWADPTISTTPEQFDDADDAEALDNEAEIESAANVLHRRAETLQNETSAETIDGIQTELSTRISKLDDLNGSDDANGFDAVSQTIDALEDVKTSLERVPEAGEDKLESVKKIADSAVKYLAEVLDREVDETIALEKASIIASQVNRNLMRLKSSDQTQPSV